MNSGVRIICSIILASIILTGCQVWGSEGQQVVQFMTGTDGYPSWNDSIFYEIFVRSFKDSDGDGIGDFKGLTSRLDYLNDGNPRTNDDLEITGIWLMPIHPAASYHGYDVIDYYAVNPEYGSLEDFRTFLAAAHQRGMRVIIDLVLNHTSIEHPWFEAAQDPASGYHDWYVWSETPLNERTWYPTAGAYYYGFFWSGMPDLNYKNPAVGEEMKKVARFWLEDVGVDGFRIDAAKYLYEEGLLIEHSADTHDWFKEFRQYYKEINPQALTVGEVWDAAPIAAEYAQGDELDLTFDFGLSQALIVAARTGRTEELSKAVLTAKNSFRAFQFATFIANHDQNRVMSQLARDPQKARMAAMLLLTLPGVPFLYYGEEIGMQGVKPDEQIRTPMQWTEKANAGFTLGQPWIEVNTDYQLGINAHEQDTSRDSLLSVYRKLIRLRSEQPALRIGEYIPVKATHSSVFTFLRAAKDQTVLVIINLTEEPIRNYQLTLENGYLAGDLKAKLLWGKGKIVSPQLNETGGFDGYQPVESIPAYDMVVVELTQ